MAEGVSVERGLLAYGASPMELRVWMGSRMLQEACGGENWEEEGRKGELNGELEDGGGNGGPRLRQPQSISSSLANRVAIFDFWQKC